MRLIRSIHDGDTKYLGDRRITYLVSEFAAGLLNERLLIQMLSLSKDSDNVDLKINVMDILSELESLPLKVIAKQYYSAEIRRIAALPMDEYKVGLYAGAGVVGFSETIDDVIRHVDAVGIHKFLDSYFVTKDHFAYYDGSQDRCEDEWINIVERTKYGETRRLFVHLLGAMESRKALPLLRRLQDVADVDLQLRTSAATAVRRITGK